MAKTLKTWYHNGQKGWKVCFYISFVLSCLLILVSFFIPPIAVIDASIFAAVGELAFFPTLYSFYNVIMSGRSATLKKGDTEITIDDNFQSK